ncbi:MAG: hypothetical protein RLY97_2276 [Pseudomonadota bacterium]|jgi:peptidoglycan/LPS O-acetylase OafA/YrhL
MSLLGLLKRLAYPQDAGAFRLWLALMVVVHHLCRWEFGKAPVLVFFALSGYWVQRVWTGQYSQTSAAWLTFAISRWWRIAPVMILASVASIAVLWKTQDREWALVLQMPWRQAVSAVTVLSYAQLNTRPVGPAWSLDIEMQFYLAAPMLAIAVRRMAWPVVVLGGVLVMEWALVTGHGVVLTSFLPWFLVGMVAADRGWKVSAAAARISFAVPIILVIGLWLTPWWGRFGAEGAADYALFNLVLAAFVLPFALWTVTRKGDAVDGFCADQSFIVYMLHWPAIVLWRHYGGSFVVAAGLIIAVGGLSWALWRFIDRPMNRWRKAWVAGRKLGGNFEISNRLLSPIIP